MSSILLKALQARSGVRLGTTIARTLHTTQSKRAKEITITTTQDKVVIEAGPCKSPREGNLILNPESECGACILCALDVKIDYTDVLILSQFMQSNGKMYPARVTGLCHGKQKKLHGLIAMAKIAGLLPNLNDPRKSRMDPYLRSGNKKFHRYFVASTLPDTEHDVARQKIDQRLGLTPDSDDEADMEEDL